jgi:hypothetical protein
MPRKIVIVSDSESNIESDSESEPRAPGMDYKELIKTQIVKTDKKKITEALGIAEKSKNLLEKCVIWREFVVPSAAKTIEQYIKKNLGIKEPENKVSGDGKKGDNKYEIKVSIHSKDGSVNIVQIRPHHDVNYYIVITMNLFDRGGKAYCLKIPAKDMYDLLPEYGGYAHGTICEYGEITPESIEGNKDSQCEYALRPKPNATKGTKYHSLWKEMKKYRVEYKPENF